MSIPEAIRSSAILRAPLLSACRKIFRLLESGPALLRRAVYDAIPAPYLVTGRTEHFLVSTRDKVIGRELFLHGEFDFSKLQLALAIIEREGLPRPRHLIDVGANIGSITIPALARGMMDTATAIEPHPANLRLLRANIALNDLCDRVRVIAQAAGSEPEVTLFLDESEHNSGNHSIGDSGIRVASSRLDDLEAPGKNALLWMDIEGYEGHALRGAERLLVDGSPVVSEFNPRFLERSGGMPWFRDALLGYRIFDLKLGISSRETTLDALASEYSKYTSWTDVLAIPPRQSQTA